MTNTTNYDLILVEGSDKVNPLTQVNPNFESIDEQMKKNADAGVSTATELLTGSIHGLSRVNADASMFRFTATSNYTAGDTFTVDGIQVTALTPTGEALGNGAYIIGSEVLCCLKGTLLTMFLSGGAITTADNALKLGGEEPSYYGTAEAVTSAQQTATAAGVLANSVQTQVTPVIELVNGFSDIIVTENYSSSAIVSGKQDVQTLPLNAGTYLVSTFMSLPVGAKGHNMMAIRTADDEIQACDVTYSDSSSLSKPMSAFAIVQLTQDSNIKVSLTSTSASAGQRISSCVTKAIKIG